jgi:hypothetical protein
MRYLKIGKSLNKKKLRKIIKHRKKMFYWNLPLNPPQRGGIGVNSPFSRERQKNCHSERSEESKNKCATFDN